MAVAATSEPDCGSVRAKAERARPARVSGSQRALLLGGAEEGEGAGAEALHGEGEVGEAVVAGEGLADEAEGADVEGRWGRRGRWRSG